MILNILDIPMVENDIKAPTIRHYLQLLLIELIDRKESFSGKRPFGNSGWEYDLYASMIKAGVIEGKLDEYDNVIEADNVKADNLIIEAIKGFK